LYDYRLKIGYTNNFEIIVFSRGAVRSSTSGGALFGDLSRGMEGGAHMSRFLPAIAIVLASSAAHADCLTKPDLRDHRGYWRYHLIQQTGQHCWYQSAARPVHARSELLHRDSDAVPIPQGRPAEQSSEQPQRLSRIDDTFDAIAAEPWLGLIQVPAKPVEVAAADPEEVRTDSVRADPVSKTTNESLLPLLAAPGTALFFVMAMYVLLRRYGDRWLAHG
jgi:hypothetical protein